MSSLLSLNRRFINNTCCEEYFLDIYIDLSCSRIYTQSLRCFPASLLVFHWLLLRWHLFLQHRRTSLPSTSRTFLELRSRTKRLISARPGLRPMLDTSTYLPTISPTWGIIASLPSFGISTLETPLKGHQQLSTLLVDPERAHSMALPAMEGLATCSTTPTAPRTTNGLGTSIAICCLSISR